MASHVTNRVLGAGKLYIAEYVNGVLGGFRYFGDTPGFTINISADRVTDDTSDGPIAEEAMNILTKVTRAASIIAKDVSLENLALFVMGTAGTRTQAGTAVTDEAIDGVAVDRYYQLGQSSANPVGVRQVSSVTVTDDQGSPTTFTEGTDYEIDLATGLLYVIAGGGITDGTSLRVSYTPSAGDIEEIASSDLGNAQVAIKYVANNTKGTNRDAYMALCDIAPNGDLAWKSRDTVAQMTFDVSILKPTTGEEALYINGQAVAA